MKTEPVQPNIQKITIADLVERFKELPQTATVENFKVVYRDKRGYPSMIESAKNENGLVEKRE